jgi:hypothetical protein
MRLGAYAELDERPPLQGDAALRWATLKVAAHRLGESRKRLATEASGFFDSVRQVVLCASSSRSGSSLLARLLSGSSQFLHFPGEINPFLRLAGLAWPESGPSDYLPPEKCTGEAIRALQDYLALEAGGPAVMYEGVTVGDEFDESLYRRLCLQWPLEEFNLAEVTTARAAALTEMERRCERRCDWAADLQLFHALFLRRIQINHPAVNPFYYDLDRTLIRELFLGLRIPDGPPSSVLIEEPPFILVRPWVRWRPADLAGRTLLLKTPSNAYRLGFLRALFPSARLRILHLTRNPAASINGIYDGWHHWGFHSHYVGSELEIPGYSEPGRADRGWWKFDLPPGWQEHTCAPLEQICAFQWRSAQTAILAFARKAGADYLRVRFEDILHSPENRLRVYRDLCSWLEMADDDNLLDALSRPLPPVMATKAPRQRRWHENLRVLKRVLNHPTILSLAGMLGYQDESEWI